MNKIKVVIVEDEFVIAEDIRSRLVVAGYDVVGIFHHAETASVHILKEPPDILLVDINLIGPMDGIDLVKQVLAKIKIPVVYITANSDASTYERARSTRPNAFLIKPFSPANLLAAVDLALYHFSRESVPEQIERTLPVDQPDDQFVLNQCLFIRANGKHKKVSSDDLLFIEAAGSYVHIQTKSERYTLSHNLAHFQKKTPLANLVRIHRSYVVNLNHIDSFDESSVFIKNHKLPLSENHKEEFLARIHLL